MSLTRSTDNSRRRIVPAFILVIVVLFSGTIPITSVYAHGANSGPTLQITPQSSITQLKLNEWNVPSAAAGPFGIAVDKFGKIWITENSSKLARFDPSNNSYTEWATPGGASQPRGIFVKQVVVSGVNSTQVFFTEYASDAVARFDVATNTFTTWTLPQAGAHPVGIYVDENDDIWFAGSGSDVIGRIHTATNNLTEWTLPGGTTSSGSPLLEPWGVYVQVVTRPNTPTNRFIWFTERLGNKVARLEANSGRLSLWDLNSLGLGQYQPTDITYGLITTIPSIIFTNFNGNRVSILWNDTGGALSTYRESLVPTVASGPIGAAFDASRNAVWFAENNVGNIANLNTTTIPAPVTITASYCTIQPNTGTPICPSPATRTFAILPPTTTPSAASLSQIQNPVVSSNIGISQGPINGVTEYSLSNKTARPTGVVLDPQGNVWFTENNATVNRIGELSAPYVFQLTVAPNLRTVTRGQIATYTVNVGLTSGIPSPVKLNLLNAPANATASFNPSSQTPTFTSTLSITTTNSTPLGTFLMNIQAISGGQTQNRSITLTVSLAPPPPAQVFDFAMNVLSQPQVTIPQGNSASFDLNIKLISGTTQTVTLNVTGLPTGATHTFTNPQGTPSFNSTLSIQTDANTPGGTYPITITGTSTGGITHHTLQTTVLIVTEVLKDFDISSSVDSVILVASSRTYVPITVTAIGFFSGDVSFGVTISPTQPGVGALFDPGTVSLQPNGNAQTTMQIVALKNTSGNYQLTITATSSNPSRTHQIVISVRVSPCLIATATFGSELAPQVQFLRDFRDKQIMQTFAGSNFMVAFNAWYYSFSPAVAQYEYSHATTHDYQGGSIPTHGHLGLRFVNLCLPRI